MSFEALAWAFRQDDLTNPTKSVLIVLAYRDNHDEPHGCFPSLARIAKDIGVHPSTVVRCLDFLEDLGLVKRTRRSDEKGDPTSTFYQLPRVWGVIADSNNPYCRPQQGVIAHRNTKVKSLTEIERETTQATAQTIVARAQARREANSERPKTNFERSAATTENAIRSVLGRSFKVGNGVQPRLPPADD